LQSDASLQEKARACQQLAIVGSRDAVGPLAALLDDEQLSHYGRFGLEPIEDPAVDDALRAAMGRLEGKLLVGVVNSIGVRRDVKAVGELQKLVRNPEKGVASAALMSLGMIATGDAIDTICEALKGDSAGLRIAAADAALKGVGRLVDMNKHTEAEKLLDVIRRSDVPGHIRIAATYNAIIIRGSSGLPLLIEQLKSDDSAMVDVALRAAREMPGPEVTEALVAELVELQPNVQVLLIKVLANRKGPKVSESLVTLAASDNPAVRSESLKVLGKVGNASAVGVLLAAVRAGGEDASIALNSLRTIKGDGINTTIIEKMKNAQPDEKAELIKVLSDRNAFVGMDAIFAEVPRSGSKVRSAAFKAIAQLAGPEDIDRVVNIVRSLRGAAGRKDGERAIVTVANKIEENSKRTDVIITAFKQEKNIDARCSLLRVLAAFADKKSFEIIRGADVYHVNIVALKQLSPISLN